MCVYSRRVVAVCVHLCVCVCVCVCVRARARARGSSRATRPAVRVCQYWMVGALRGVSPVDGGIFALRLFVKHPFGGEEAGGGGGGGEGSSGSGVPHSDDMLAAFLMPPRPPASGACVAPRAAFVVSVWPPVGRAARARMCRPPRLVARACECAAYGARSRWVWQSSVSVSSQSALVSTRLL